MRVLQVTSHLDPGGIGTHVVTLARALVRRGHEVGVAAEQGPLSERLVGSGVAHWPLGLKTSAEFGLKAFQAGRELSMLAREWRPDLVHAHTRVSHVLAGRLSKQLGIPYVTTWHGYFRRNLGRRIWPYAGHRAIAVSEPVGAHLRDDLRLPAPLVSIIPNGVDVDWLGHPAQPGASPDVRAGAGLAVSAPIVGSVSRLVHVKEVDLLLRAVARLRVRRPGVQLLIVGDGPDRTRLEALGRELALAPPAVFAGSRPDPRPLLACMDVFVFLPAMHEGFGLTLLEAMASGRPVVAVRRKGVSWLLDQAGAGVQVASPDPDALAEAMERLLAEPVRAAELAKRGRQIVRERFSAEVMAEAVERVYRQVCPA